MKEWIKQLETYKFGEGKYSQSYQDELLEIIFNNVGTVNDPPYCVEFGFNTTTLTGGSGANTARFILDRKWKSLLLDGSCENAAINLRKHFLLPSNICEVFRKYEVPREPEYISIDVDSTDLWLFEAVLREYRARVFTVEYNSNFPLEAAITFPNEPGQMYERDRGYGASLKALNLVAMRNGYSLLWVVPALDTFFIRNDLIDDGSGVLTFPLEKWRNCTDIKCHRPLRNKERAKMFVDYETYVKTGDMELSKQSAYPVSCKVLLDESYPNFALRAWSKLRRFVSQ